MNRLTLENMTEMVREKESNIGDKVRRHLKDTVNREVVTALGKKRGNKTNIIYVSSVHFQKKDRDVVMKIIEDYLSELGLKVRPYYIDGDFIVITGIRRLRKRVR